MHDFRVFLPAAGDLMLKRSTSTNSGHSGYNTDATPTATEDGFQQPKKRSWKRTRTEENTTVPTSNSFESLADVDQDLTETTSTATPSKSKTTTVSENKNTITKQQWQKIVPIIITELQKRSRISKVIHSKN